MNRPNPAPTAAASAAVSGAADLSALKGHGDSRWILDVTEQTFQSDVVDRSMQVPVTVSLWATSCGRCTQQSSVLERLAEAARGAWVLARVESDANPRIAQLLTDSSVRHCWIVAFAGGEAHGIAEVEQWVPAYLDGLRDVVARVRATVRVNHRGRDLHPIRDAAQAAPSDDAGD